MVSWVETYGCSAITPKSGYNAPVGDAIDHMGQGVVDFLHKLGLSVSNLLKLQQTLLQRLPGIPGTIFRSEANGTRREKRRTRQNADANRADVLVGVLGAQKDHFMLPMSTRGR
jgi:hypothetical protein